MKDKHELITNDDYSYDIENEEYFKDFLKETICKDITNTKLHAVSSALFIFVGCLKNSNYKDNEYTLCREYVYCTAGTYTFDIEGGIVKVKTLGNNYNKILELYHIILEKYDIPTSEKITCIISSID